MHGLRHLLLLQCLLLPCSALLTVTVSSRPTTIVTRRAPLPELAAPRESKGQRRMSVFDAVAMVSGSAVGGGFLAVPDVTAPLGILPSTVGLTLTWLFLVMAGLAYVEAAGAASGEGRGASILALSRHAFGTKRASLISVIFLAQMFAVSAANLIKAAELATISAVSVSLPVLHLHLCTYAPSAPSAPSAQSAQSAPRLNLRPLHHLCTTLPTLPRLRPRLASHA